MSYFFVSVLLFSVFPQKAMGESDPTGALSKSRGFHLTAPLEESLGKADQLPKSIRYYKASAPDETYKAKGLFPKQKNNSGNQKAQTNPQQQNSQQPNLFPKQKNNSGNQDDTRKATRPIDTQQGGNKPTKPDIAFLERISQKHNALEIHNKALSLLRDQKKAPAILLLKRNAYQKLFPPSGLLLARLNMPPDPIPFLRHIALLLSLGFSAWFLFLAFKKPSFFRLQLSTGALLVSACLLAGGIFLLKKKACPLEDIHLKVAPFANAPEVSTETALSELAVLKQTEGWLMLRGHNNQKGWVKQNRVFRVF